jgi:prolyl-tRNA synthetase
MMMRMSKLFSQTLRDTPVEAETANHALLLRAGFIRPLAAGIFDYLPLGRRSMDKIQRIMREEMDRIGGQEITMPVVQPAELWQESGRWYAIGSEMGRFKDKNNRDMVLAMTHEEAAADLIRREIRSYRQLPALIYHIQTKWRDDPRPRAGLIRVREFTMLDSYSLDADWQGLQRQYDDHYAAYHHIYERCGLPVRAVKADTGMMGGKVAHEFMYLTPIGEDTLAFCTRCDYSANRQVARFKRPEIPAEDPLPLEKVATPHASSIAELAEFLRIPTEKTAKAVFFSAEIQGRETPLLVFALVRGDMEANETKLTNLVHAKDLRPATDDEIRRVGAEPGYASPIGLKPHPDLMVIADEMIPDCRNLAAGANEAGFHFIQSNYGRDYTANLVADIASIRAGDCCPECGTPVELVRGVEVANIFQLGTRYSDALGCTFTAEDGSIQPVIMGSYGIGVGRLLACLAEEHHDERGLCLPASVAPYHIHIVCLPGKTIDTLARALELAASLEQAGLEVLLDDRMDASAGVKFNDADLIGLPVRLTVSEKALNQGGIEYKLRRSDDRQIIPVDTLVGQIKMDLALA